MLTIRSLILRALAFLLRFMARLGTGTLTPSPTQTFYIPSRSETCTIKVHLYAPKITDSPSPVLINFHGSGWVLPLHGSDEEYCRLIANNTGYTVLDVQYRLSPENPWPAANEDAEDVVNWARSQPQFRGSKIALSGFSAGANIALVTSRVTFPKGVIDTVIAFYPSTNLTIPSAAKAAPDTSGKPMPHWLSKFFKACFLRPGADQADPRISPIFAQPDGFPAKVLVVTAACDTLCFEGEKFAEGLREKDREVVCYRAQKCNHGWDKEPVARTAGTVQEGEKRKAYEMAVDFLRS